MLYRKLSEGLHIDHAQRAILRSVQINPRDTQVGNFSATIRLVGFEPARGAQAPLATTLKTDGAQVVAARCREVKELVGDYAGYGMVARIDAAGAAVSIAEKARRWLLREQP